MIWEFNQTSVYLQKIKRGSPGMAPPPETSSTPVTSSPYRRNVALLAVAQAMFMTTQSMGIATTPLAGYSLLGADKSLATLPIFLTHAGIMATTISASLLMGRIGRLNGFSIGAVLTEIFGLLAAFAIWIQSFELLCVAAFIQGSGAAFAWYYRFAAADTSPAAFKPKAIAYVMAGGIVAGLVGPELAKLGVDWFAPVTFLGVYLVISLVGGLNLVLMQGLRIPKLTVAEKADGGRPLGIIMRQPAYIAALNRTRTFAKPIATRLETGSFYAAEAYHQQFMRRNPNHPYILAWDVARVQRLKARFPGVYVG